MMKTLLYRSRYFQNANFDQLLLIQILCEMSKAHYSVEEIQEAAK